MKEQEVSLFVVATPIGNLDDITFRGKTILQEVNWIAAEDTRHTMKLLSSFGIQKELISLHEHSSEQKIQALVGRLKEGERAAYVSDAGTPGISDPGADLVKAAWESGLKVSPIPGASAITALLSASGFSFSDFAFCGFFPRENRDRERLCEKILKSAGVYVFYESPHRVREFCNVLMRFFPEEKMALGRELTKRYEEIRVGKVNEICGELKDRTEILGEFVIALEISKKAETAEDERFTLVEIQKLLTELYDLGANQKILLATAKALGMKRAVAYDLALEIMKKR